MYKNVNGVDVIVNPDGSAVIEGWGDWFTQKLAELAGRGGWKDLQWLKDLQNKGDRGWDDLFDKSTNKSGRKDDKPKDPGAS